MWQKIVKWVLIPVFFFAVFLLALYWTFPARVLKPYITYQIENSIRAEHEGRWVHPPEVVIKDLSLWRLSGLSLKNVTIRMGSLDEKLGSRWEFEKLRFRMGILGTLLGRPKIEFGADLYEGSMKGAVTVKTSNQISDFWIEVNDVDLKEFSGFEESIGLPLNGRMSLNAEFDFGKNPSQDGEGYLKFGFEKLNFGPGKVILPMPGFSEGLSVPYVNLGSFNGDLTLNKGKGKTRALKISGGDIEADASISVELNKDIMRSKIDGDGWFKISDDFLQKNPALKVLVANMTELKMARQSDGKYPFSIKGTFDRPRPKLGKDEKSTSNQAKNPLRSFRS